MKFWQSFKDEIYWEIQFWKHQPELLLAILFSWVATKIIIYLLNQ